VGGFDTRDVADLVDTRETDESVDDGAWIQLLARA